MSGAYRGLGARHPARWLGLRRAVLRRDQLPNDFPAHIFDAIEAASHEPYKGITADGEVVHDLFALEDVDASTAAIVQAALELSASLSDEQRRNAMLEVDADDVRRWTNAFPLWEPHGVFLDELDASQRDLALGVVAASMSDSGFAETRQAMRLNDHLGEITGDVDRESLGELTYFFAIFGEPSEHGAWGWQLWGHHLVVTCFLVGGQMVMTPLFVGAEPTVVDDGPMAGQTILAGQRELGLAMLDALTPAQQDKATLSTSLRAADLPPELNHPTEGRHRSGNGRDNVVFPYEGICVAELSEQQRRVLMRLVASYVERMPDPWAGRRLEEVERHLDDTWFAWMGAADADAAIYYCVHSPVILIEFDNHNGVFLDNPEPTSVHAHTIVRTPNGNDYARALLRQHAALAGARR